SNKTIAFVGALDYLPNIDAATWFAREVWPEIHRQRPDASFRIIGRNPGGDVNKLAAIPGIEIVGSVPDVRPHLADTSVVVPSMRRPAQIPVRPRCQRSSTPASSPAPAAAPTKPS